MKFYNYFLVFTLICGCSNQELNTVKYKFRSEEVVKKECSIAIDQKKFIRRTDINSKNFITKYTKAFNANNKIKRACNPYR